MQTVHGLPFRSNFPHMLLMTSGEIKSQAAHWLPKQLMIRVFSRLVALLVVTMETFGQTNQQSMTTGSPPYLIIRSC